MACSNMQGGQRGVGEGGGRIKGGAEVQVGAPSCVHSYHPCMWARGRGQIITRPEIHIFWRVVLDYYAVTMAQIGTVNCQMQAN